METSKKFWLDEVKERVENKISEIVNKEIEKVKALLPENTEPTIYYIEDQPFVEVEKYVQLHIFNIKKELLINNYRKYEEMTEVNDIEAFTDLERMIAIAIAEVLGGEVKVLRDKEDRIYLVVKTPNGVNVRVAKEFAEDC